MESSCLLLDLLGVCVHDIDCGLTGHRFKEAVNECTSALAVDPTYAKALVRRSKAYENMQLYKQALTDIQKANKVDSANPDTQVGRVQRTGWILVLFIPGRILCPTGDVLRERMPRN